MKKCSGCSKPIVLGELQFCSEACIGRHRRVLSADYELKLVSLATTIDEAARLRKELHDTQALLVAAQEREAKALDALRRAETARDQAIAQLPPLQREIHDLRNALKVNETRIRELETRLAEVDRDRNDALARLKELGSRPTEPSNNAALDELNRRLAEAEAKLLKSQKAAMQLQARIVELEYELSDKTPI